MSFATISRGHDADFTGPEYLVNFGVWWVVRKRHAVMMTFPAEEITYRQKFGKNAP